MKISTDSTHVSDAISSANTDTLPAEATKVILRQVHTALVALAAFLLVNVSIRVDYILLGNTLGETSITEMLEQCSLFITSLAFFLIGRQRPSLRHASYLISAFFLVMLIRELDFWFDMLAHGAWIYPALTVTIAAISFAAQNGKNTIHQLAVILSSPYMTTLVISVVLLLVYTRLFGMGKFWIQVMGDHYVRDVKNIAEEGSELLAYCLICLSAIKVRSDLMQLKRF